MRRLQPAPDLLIFDLDGTLVDSQDQIARSFNVALRAVGAPAVAHELVYAMIGLPLVHMFGQALPATLHGAIHDCIEVYREDYDRVEVPRSTAFPGVAETLAACQAAGRTLTVATTKSWRVAEDVLEAAGLRSCFSLVLGGDCVPNHKPAPDLVLLTLERTGRAPQSALVIGDSSYDILMASAAGVTSCGVSYGAQSADALLLAGATYMIDAMPELQELVGATSPPVNLTVLPERGA